MHCALCLTQALHGICLSHLTFLSEQRTHANADFAGRALEWNGKGFMVNGIRYQSSQEKDKRPHSLYKPVVKLTILLHLVTTRL